MYILSHSDSEPNLFLDSLLMTKLGLSYRHYRKSLEKEKKTQIIAHSCSGRSHLLNLQCLMPGVHQGCVSSEATVLLRTVTQEAYRIWQGCGYVIKFMLSCGWHWVQLPASGIILSGYSGKDSRGEGKRITESSKPAWANTASTKPALTAQQALSQNTQTNRKQSLKGCGWLSIVIKMSRKDVKDPSPQLLPPWPPQHSLNPSAWRWQWLSLGLFITSIPLPNPEYTSEKKTPWQPLP